MAQQTAQNRVQTTQILELVKGLFNYTVHFNDARTRTARRLKCVQINAIYEPAVYDNLAVELCKHLDNAGLSYIRLFFVSSSPGSSMPGVVLHIILPNNMV